MPSAVTCRSRVGVRRHLAIDIHGAEVGSWLGADDRAGRPNAPAVRAFVFLGNCDEAS